MRKKVFGRKFKRDKNERQALFKNLMAQLVLNERIKTTQEKAKAIKPQVEKLVTKVKQNEKQSVNQVQKYLSGQALHKMVNEIGPRFKDRNGGYTKITRIGKRVKDNAEMAIIEWSEVVLKSESKAAVKKPTIKKGVKEVKKTAKKTSKKKKKKS